jgi:hypothetical protein
MASIDSNMSELEALILREVDYVEKDVPLEFAKLASEIRNQLIGGNFKNRTGNLRRSIQVYEVDGNMIIEMLNYGYFISFGVNGGQQTQSNRVYGIDPRDFYPMDLENKLINILTNGDTAT